MEMSARKRFSQCFCLWILCRSCFCSTISSPSLHHSLEHHFDYDPDYTVSPSILPHFFDSESMEDTSSTDNQIRDSSVSETEEDEEQEDEFPDASSHPVVTLTLDSATSSVLNTMNQDEPIDRAINDYSVPPSEDMIDELLGRGSSGLKQFPLKGEMDEDLFAAAGRHYQQPAGSAGQHGFFQYARQPAKGAWEFGYRRGNNEHFTERHEQGASHHVKSKIRWGDKYGGYGEHYFDYNHKGIGEEMPTQRPTQTRQQQQRQRYYNRYAASEALPVHQEWPE